MKIREQISERLYAEYDSDEVGIKLIEESKYTTAADDVIFLNPEALIALGKFGQRIFRDVGNKS